MPRKKKQVLKKRKDGRYACRYKDKWFYSDISSDDALDQRNDYIRRLKTGELYNQTVTVFEYGVKWLKIAHPAVSKATYIGLSIHLQHLVNQLGNVPICDVKPLQIKEVYSEEYPNVSNSYLKAAKQLFCALFDAAVADGICRVNPARQKPAQPHRGTEGGHRAITEQEREWINTFCHDHRAYPAIITMLYAGIRPQEAKALTIEKALDGDVLHITETAHRDGNNQYEITKKGKSKNAIRDIPVFPPVEEALSNRKGLLITTAKGKQITATAWRNAMDSYRSCMEAAINGMPKRWYKRTKEHKKILERADQLRKEGKKEEAKVEEGKIPPWIEFNVVPYDLRHSFCTMCRDNGVELHTCIEWMGHADATMIMKIYDEVSDNRSKTEAEKLKKSLFRSQNGSQEDQEEPGAVDNQDSQDS
jgi:integrase